MSISFTGAYLINTKNPERMKQMVINNFHPSQPFVALTGDFHRKEYINSGNVLVLTGSEAKDYFSLAESFQSYLKNSASNKECGYEKTLEKLKREYAKNATYLDLTDFNK